MEVIAKPKIFSAKVMHKRLTPKENSFIYSVYYLSLPLNKLGEVSEIINHNKFGITTFYDKDHGKRDGSDLRVWVNDIIKENGINQEISEITLIALPRILGYVFNPVSFYLCFDAEKKLKIMVCEVNNTFGETHTYICHNNGNDISPDEYLETEKIFHVSPFIEREGHYKFRFSLKDESLGIWIDLYDQNNNKKLITSLTGKFIELNKANLRSMFFKCPLVTLKTIFLIHYQAVKLVFKGIKYISKPSQKTIKISITR